MYQKNTPTNNHKPNEVKDEPMAKSSNVTNNR